MEEHGACFKMRFRGSHLNPGPLMVLLRRRAHGGRRHEPAFDHPLQVETAPWLRDVKSTAGSCSDSSSGCTFPMFPQGSCSDSGQRIEKEHMCCFLKGCARRMGIPPLESRMTDKHEGAPSLFASGRKSVCATIGEPRTCLLCSEGQA